MKINNNYLNIFKEKQKKFFFNDVFIKNLLKNIRITKRQKFWWVVCLLSLGVAFIMKAQTTQTSSNSTEGGSKDMATLVGELFDTSRIDMDAESKDNLSLAIQQEIVRSNSGMDYLKRFLKWIANIQIDSIEKVNNLSFGTRGMFDFLIDGITIFAVIGCLYKLITHFLNTERHDNVKAYTGYFQYLSIAVLFVFSGQIVDRVVGLNQQIKSEEIKSMTTKLDNQLNRVIAEDLKKPIGEIRVIVDEIKRLQDKHAEEWVGVETGLQIFKSHAQIWKITAFDINLSIAFKYIYFTVVIGIICSVMAVPAFVLSVMVKILLTVMVAGTKLVFLLAFIPGFESTWKTFMLNLLNILLWIPIFNAIYSFIIALIISMMNDATLSSGQIVWLTIVSVILAFQSLSLTTSAAGVVINGAGASMAGAMGSLATMNGVNAGLGVVKAAAGAAGAVVRVGMAAKGASTLGNISKSLSNLEKHMKK